MLSDEDFEQVTVTYGDLDVITMNVVKEIDILPFIRCPEAGCGRLIGQYTDIIQKLIDDEHKKEINKSGRRMTVSEYNKVITSILEKADMQMGRKMRRCCRIHALEPMKVPITQEEDNGIHETRIRRYIPGSGSVMGNVKVVRLEPKPFDPYTFESSQLDDDLDISEEEKFSESSSEDLMPSTNITMLSKITRNIEGFEDLFPHMPAIDDSFVEELFSIEMKSTKGPTPILYGYARTGIKGLEVPIVKSTSILAR